MFLQLVGGTKDIEMKITLVVTAALPNEQSDELPTVSGDIIRVNGQDYDLSQLPDGAEVEAAEPFVGKIVRVNGQIELTVQYKYNADLAKPVQSSNIDDCTFVVTDGQCPDPIAYKQVLQEPENVD